MKNIVIVHGAFQTAAAWSGVAAALEAKGHRVVTVNLPARNAERVGQQSVSLTDYVKAVESAMAKMSEPVILVGHSFGGMTISTVAEAGPQRLVGLVYVAAYLPKDGDSMQALSEVDGHNRIDQDNFIVAPDWSYAEILMRDRAMLFANDADDQLAHAIAENMVREPLAPMGEVVTLSAERFGSVPKVYIKTLRDNVVSPSLQDRMIATTTARVVEIDAGHGVAETKTAALADLIAEAFG